MDVTHEEELNTLLAGTPQDVQILIAAITERVAQLFTGPVGADGDRIDDVETYLQVLEDLWSVRLDDPERWNANAAQLAALPELAAEDEPSGALAFAYHALAVTYYACEYRRTGDSTHAFHAGVHSINTMYFLSEYVGDREDRMEQERSLRRKDFSDLGYEPINLPTATETIRDRSRRRASELVMSLMQSRLE